MMAAPKSISLWRVFTQVITLVTGQCHLSDRNLHPTISISRQTFNRGPGAEAKVLVDCLLRVQYGATAYITHC